MLDIFIIACVLAYYKKLMMPLGLLDRVGTFFHWKFRKLTFFLIFRDKFNVEEEPDWHYTFYKCIPCSFFRLGLIATIPVYFYVPGFEQWHFYCMPFAIGILSSIFYRHIKE